MYHSKPFYVNPSGLLSNAMENDRIIRAFFPDALGIQYRIAFFFSVFSTHDAHPYGFKTIVHDSWVCIGARSCPVVFEKSKSNWSSGSRLNDLFRKEMQQRGASIVKARKASSAMSTARAVVDHIHDLHFGTRQGDLEINVDHGKFKLTLICIIPSSKVQDGFSTHRNRHWYPLVKFFFEAAMQVNWGEFVSMGVWSDHGAYSITDSLIFSVPVVCDGGGKYHVYKGQPDWLTGCDWHLQKSTLLDQWFAKFPETNMPAPSVL